MTRLLLITLILGFLSACASTEGALTLEANHALAGTQVADLRITASVQAARAETTLDFMGTRASLGATQSVFLEETLVATGFAPDAIATRRQVILGSTPTPLPTETLRPEETQAVIIGSQVATLPPTAPPVTLNAPNPTTPPQVALPSPTFDPDELYVTNVITATGAGDDGCGTGVTSIFGMDTPEIYVIAPAFNIEANGATFGARWERDGIQVGPIYTFVPDFSAEQLCIWFFVDETDFEFIAGAYTVTIEIDGQPAANPAPFIIQ